MDKIKLFLALISFVFAFLVFNFNIEIVPFFNEVIPSAVIFIGAPIAIIILAIYVLFIRDRRPTRY